MPRYLVERIIPSAGELTGPELKAIAQQCLVVVHELGPGVKWIRSYFTDDRMVCLYLAPDEMALWEHAQRSGLPIHRISEVSAIIDPTIGDLG